MNIKRRWTEEEIKILRDFWPTKGSKFVEKMLINRNWQSVQRQAIRIGLKCLDRVGIHKEGAKTIVANNKSCDLEYFKTWSPNMAYILGYIFADGCVNKYTVGFLCHSKDEEIILAIHKELKCKGKINRRPAQQIGGRNNGPRTSFQINSILVRDYLQENFGLCQRKTWANIPMPKVPDELFGHFLRGYSDGDGHIKKSKKHKGGHFTFIGTELFVTDMRDTIIRLANVQENKVCEQKGKRLTKVMHVAFWSRQKDLKEIYNLMYPEGDYIYLTRKRNAFKEAISVEIKDKPLWTKQEDDHLRKLYHSFGATELARLLKRPVGSVKYRALRLGVLVYKSRKS